MNTAYKTTVGLEIHAELKTRTKMFCNSKNDTDEKEPNVNICPVCMGHPGTLPVINKEAVKHVLKMGVAVGGTLADFTEFDRKNYFYPDIPKAYQISQYKYPLVKDGVLAGVKLTRIHLEEDTAKSSHDDGDDAAGKVGDYSLVDFNRAGLPLMELVTEPVIGSAEEAVRFAKEMQLLLQYLGAGDANMEKGEMRVEANISVSADHSKFGTKVEVKNINSFRAVERAIAYEVDRHIRLLEKGEKVVQETRGWDEVKQVTFSQRLKEESHDYRYFPDPDLPKLYISEIPEFHVDKLKAEIPSLPWEKREHYQKMFELKEDDAEVFVNNIAPGNYFESVIVHFKGDKKLIKLAANYIISDYLGLLKSDSEAAKMGGATALGMAKITPENFAELMQMIGEGKLTSRAAKDLLPLMYKEGGKASSIAEAKGMLQKNDEGELKRIMTEIVAASPKAVADYKGGKIAALQAIVGRGMKETKGSANPELLKKIVTELLG